MSKKNKIEILFGLAAFASYAYEIPQINAIAFASPNMSFGAFVSIWTIHAAVLLGMLAVVGFDVRARSRSEAEAKTEAEVQRMKRLQEAARSPPQPPIRVQLNQDNMNVRLMKYAAKKGHLTGKVVGDHVYEIAKDMRIDVGGDGLEFPIEPDFFEEEEKPQAPTPRDTMTLRTFNPQVQKEMQ